MVIILCGLTGGLSLLFGRELDRRAAAEVKLAHLSQTDALTGLPNRRRFDEVFTRAWKSMRRTGKPLSLLLVDADHFKRYNDRYGHMIGDTVLKGLGHCLADSVPRPNDLVARIGGEEFALLLPDTGEAEALRIAENVHTRIARLAVEASGIPAGTVTVSIGLAGAKDGDGEAAELYQRADEALYAAKAGGRNRTERAVVGAARIDRLEIVPV
jgi:diguanylate cyclase (GGDEF)-like protein